MPKNFRAVSISLWLRLNICCSLRLRLRWGLWHQLGGKQHVVVSPAETSGEVYRAGQGEEYFLLENRGPGRLDQLREYVRTVELSGGARIVVV